MVNLSGNEFHFGIGQRRTKLLWCTQRRAQSAVDRSMRLLVSKPHLVLAPRHRDPRAHDTRYAVSASFESSTTEVMVKRARLLSGIQFHFGICGGPP
jgi:hypothetical protein